MKAIFSMWILFIFLPLLSQGQQRWGKIIGDDDLTYVVTYNTISYDRGELISAIIGNFSSMNHILKVDRNGDILWSKRTAYENLNGQLGIKQFTNGNIIVYGSTGKYASVLMLDACANLLWCNDFDIGQDYAIDYYDGVFLENGDIVLLMQIDLKNGKDFDVALVSFDADGNFLWFHQFNAPDMHPNIFTLVTWHLDLFDDFLIITGWGYYTYPENPNLGYLKPMFIKTDAGFNEEWLLPYGLAETGPQDTILGDARGVVAFNNGILYGWGSATKPSGKYKSILMNFDTAGIETTHYVIEHEMLDSTTTENFFLDVAVRDDTSYFTSLKYGNLGWNNPTGEAIIDTMANVYKHQSHEEANLVGGRFPVEKDTINNQYYLAYWSYDDELVLYKFNNDLTDTPIDTNTYNYDSLCNNLPIVSDTIYVNGCNIITSLEEELFPVDENGSTSNPQITITPNPVTDWATFTIINAKEEKISLVWCYGIDGMKIMNKTYNSGTNTFRVNTSNWPDGLYFVVAETASGKRISAKFIIR